MDNPSPFDMIILHGNDDDMMRTFFMIQVHFIKEFQVTSHHGVETFNDIDVLEINQSANYEKITMMAHVLLISCIMS